MKKRIIVVTTHMTNGGAQRVLSSLVNEWRKNNNEVMIIQTRPGTYSDSYALDRGADIINLKVRGNELVDCILNVPSLIKILRKYKDATVVAFLNSCITLVGLASFFVPNRIIFSERNDPDQYPTKRIKRNIRDMMFRRADVCVFQTEDARNHFHKKVQNKGVIIPNPVNDRLPDRYQGQREKKIVAVGRLSKQKNFPLLIKAFTEVHKKYPEYKLLIYGNDEGEGDNLRKLINELYLDSSVILMGFCSDIYGAINNATMYVSSSDYEGISNSMIEALGLGLPTICTDCPVGGARQMIHNGVNGILVPINDQGALVNAMLRIIEDRKFAEEIANEAYGIRKQYPVDKVSQMWINLM